MCLLRKSISISWGVYLISNRPIFFLLIHWNLYSSRSAQNYCETKYSYTVCIIRDIRINIASLKMYILPLNTFKKKLKYFSRGPSNCTNVGIADKICEFSGSGNFFRENEWTTPCFHVNNRKSNQF